MKFTIDQKTIGSFLIGFSLILLFILIWVKINVDTEQGFLCEVVEERPDLSMEQCPAHESNTSWLIIAGFFIVFLVFASGLFLLFYPELRQKEDSPKSEKIDVSLLQEYEKKMYDLLILNQGSMYQSDIIKELGLSKVKVSRILDKMEGKHIIERKRRGMTNIIVLR